MATTPTKITHPDGAVKKEKGAKMKWGTIQFLICLTIPKMVTKGFIDGTGTGKKDTNGLPADLDLSLDMIRVFVTNDGAGLYGE